MQEEGFIYERLHTAPGIKLETVSGGAGRSRRAFELLARQVWSENARNGYRTIDHTADGAPLLWADEKESQHQRISVSHTDGLFAVATLPPAPADIDLEVFNPKTSLGIDVERIDRQQVLKVRERFLNEEELKLIPADNFEANIIAWTCKEAMLKLSLNPSVDIRSQLIINKLPKPGSSEGTGTVILSEIGEIPVLLHSIFLNDNQYIASLAFTAQTLNYKKS